MHVVATAGHVDHGKSTLVRALTGSDPDRLAEEKRRGLTIALGYAWTDLPSGERVSFVDVPGHERFLATMLAGVGPVPAVLLVVAADEGWRRQTGEHVAALDALGVAHGLVAVTRSDLADPAAATAETTERLAGTSLAGSPVVAVSGRTGAGLDDLRAALDVLVAGLPRPETPWRQRFFVDRAFGIRGAGTVVTGTLTAGRLAVGDVLAVPAGGTVTVRGLESCDEPYTVMDAVARVALNLRGSPELAHGDALTTPGTWPAVVALDVELRRRDPAERLPGQLLLHVGAAAVGARVRVLAGQDRFARLTLATPVPLEPGDRGVLRDPGRHAVAAAVTVLDVDPPDLGARGAARRRAAELAARQAIRDPIAELRRRGQAPRALLAQLGVLDPRAPLPPGLLDVGAGWVAEADGWAGLARSLGALVAEHRRAEPLSPGLAQVQALAQLGLPTADLVGALVGAAGLVLRDGRLTAPADDGPQVPPALRPGYEQLVAHLTATPFTAPEAAELAGLGLGHREIGALAAARLVLRLPGDIVLLPDAPARAAATLAGLPAPFTLSAARGALATTRRTAVPLLEHLDATGVTRRLPDSTRVLR